MCTAFLDETDAPPTYRQHEVPKDMPSRYLTHDQERQLGKTAWDEISTKFLKPGHNGQLHMPRMKATRTELPHVSVKELHDLFPHLPFINPSPAKKRALDLLHSTSDQVWTSKLKGQALMFWAAQAASIVLAYIAPEVTAREEMLKHKRYWVKREDGRYDQTACKLNCPWCKTNAFVLIDELNVHKKSSLRYAYGDNCAVMPISHGYICCNPDCSRVKSQRSEVEIRNLRTLTRGGLYFDEHGKIPCGPAKNKITQLKGMGAPFFAHDTNVMMELPPKVRATYKGLVFWGFEDSGEQLCQSNPRSKINESDTDESDNEQSQSPARGQGGCTQALAIKTIKSALSLTDQKKAHADIANANANAAMHDYIAFVEEQETSTSVPNDACYFGAEMSVAGENKWPEWVFFDMNNSLLHPTARNLRNILLEYHKIYKPYLLGDIVRRSPGRGASSDGTFRVILRTRTDGRVLILVIGDEHSIIAWYVCRSESWEELRVGLEFLRDRLTALGVLHLLKAWWSDRCCEGAQDVKQHLLCQIFPGVERAPYRDLFHAIDGITKTANPLPIQKADLGKDVFNALREIPDEELVAPVKWIKKKTRGIAHTAACARARREYRKNGIIRNRAFTPGVQKERLLGVIDKWKKRKSDADKAEPKERCCIKTCGTGREKGTIQQMEALLPCIHKECLQQPFPMEEMWLDTKVSIYVYTLLLIRNILTCSMTDMP